MDEYAERHCIDYSFEIMMETPRLGVRERCCVMITRCRSLHSGVSLERINLSVSMSQTSIDFHFEPERSRLKAAKRGTRAREN
jgi:hypothetical protein